MGSRHLHVPYIRILVHSRTMFSKWWTSGHRDPKVRVCLRMSPCMECLQLSKQSTHTTKKTATHTGYRSLWVCGGAPDDPSAATATTFRDGIMMWFLWQKFSMPLMYALFHCLIASLVVFFFVSSLCDVYCFHVYMTVLCDMRASVSPWSATHLARVFIVMLRMLFNVARILCCILQTYVHHSVSLFLCCSVSPWLPFMCTQKDHAQRTFRLTVDAFYLRIYRQFEYYIIGLQ